MHYKQEHYSKISREEMNRPRFCKYCGIDISYKINANKDINRFKTKQLFLDSLTEDQLQLIELPFNSFIKRYIND